MTNHILSPIVNKPRNPPLGRQLSFPQCAIILFGKIDSTKLVPNKTIFTNIGIYFFKPVT